MLAIITALFVEPTALFARTAALPARITALFDKATASSARLAASFAKTHIIPNYYNSFIGYRLIEQTDTLYGWIRMNTNAANGIYIYDFVIGK